MQFLANKINDLVSKTGLLDNRPVNFHSFIQIFTMPTNLIKIVFVTLLLLSFASRVSAPTRDSVLITYTGRVEPYKRLIYAIGKVETGCDTLAYNPIEEAAGFFQIRPIRLEDYNKRTGSNYKMNDLFNYEISEKIFLYYASQIGPYDLEKIAKNWNGSGRHTFHYWERIREYLWQKPI
jgi:hypothetical protein